MTKIITVLGARPQFVKAAIVSQALRQEASLEEVVVHTGQHYDSNLSQVFFDELEMTPPHFHLGVGSASHAKQTGEMMIKLEALFLSEKPDWLLIYGDTNSTLAGALTAAKLHIPIAHVEAGLRSYNHRMPEEVNRILADQVSSLLFTPTSTAFKNLKQEGFADSRIAEVGDVMYDAALFYLEKALQKSSILERLDCNKTPYVLATIHRPENTDDLSRLKNIFTALEQLNQTIRVIMPLHPRTRHLLEKHFPGWLNHLSIKLIEPIGFFDMILLEKNAALIITDSGGVQKEAFFYQVPCLTLRDQTEWVETIELGWNKLVQPHEVDLIYEEAMQALSSKGLPHHFPYGKGNASHLITQRLKEKTHAHLDH